MVSHFRAGRRPLDPRLWPILALGAMFALGCTVHWSNFDARVLNESSHPITVEYSGRTDGRNVEKWSVQVPPGGSFERHLQGREVRAGAHISGPDRSPLEVEFWDGRSECVVKDHDGGITMEQRPDSRNAPK